MLISIAFAVFFVLKALEDKIVFFYTPTNLSEDPIVSENFIRVGGLVLENSIKYSSDGLSVNFTITDNENMIDVMYSGILPDLFREKQGVVVEGKLKKSTNIFYAETVLAKHDENYMPPEVKKAIKGK